MCRYLAPPGGGSIAPDIWTTQPETTRTEKAEAGSKEMAAAAVAEFQRARSLVGTDRNASIDILHSIGKYNRH